ncbi:unnamed protein product [Acanthoscelides obtectus]|uniref:Uncharacterized protein n=1 Tax=Acanthoscelides obtectus TaxID=200917 RepID=A0A9P0MC46_ACAOB|nr:unnamed protein product [Acanthoscelides obtectus]CAK1675932.1 Carboxyl-terminal PDZ ligand of neuronal nitric oxide synthase protein [Acanthoscelides obtectus]
MPSKRQYDLVQNDEYDTRIPLHPEEAFHHGITFQAKLDVIMQLSRQVSSLIFCFCLRLLAVIKHCLLPKEKRSVRGASAFLGGIIILSLFVTGCTDPSLPPFAYSTEFRCKSQIIVVKNAVRNNLESWVIIPYKYKICRENCSKRIPECKSQIIVVRNAVRNNPESRVLPSGLPQGSTSATVYPKHLQPILNTRCAVTLTYRSFNFFNV